MSASFGCIPVINASGCETFIGIAEALNRIAARSTPDIFIAKVFVMLMIQN